MGRPTRSRTETVIDTFPRFDALERATRLSDRVADSILELITSATLRPGDRLPSERDLAARFGVSRTAVREALRSLTAKGVITIGSGGRASIARVKPDTASEALRLYVQSARSGEGEEGISYAQVNDVREMIELRVTRLAATEARNEDLMELRRLHEQMSEAAERDVAATSALDVAFHRGIAAATHNPLYLVMLDSIEPVLLEIRRATLKLPGRPRAALEAHGRVLEMLEARSPTKAERAMREHLADSRAMWEGYQREGE